LGLRGSYLLYRNFEAKEKLPVTHTKSEE
jgi:hypothetical protein